MEFLLLASLSVEQRDQTEVPLLLEEGVLADEVAILDRQLDQPMLLDLLQLRNKTISFVLLILFLQAMKDTIPEEIGRLKSKGSLCQRLHSLPEFHILPYTNCHYIVHVQEARKFC